MSMHLIEDLVEGSIRVLHDHAPVGDRRVRDWIAALYRFHDTYDCSFTHFRVMDILLERGYTFRFPIDEHPEYVERREFFDGLADFTALTDGSDDPPDSEDRDDLDDWLDRGFVDPPFLYCDAGTALWRQMIELGKLTGEHAEPLGNPHLAEVVHEVVVAAEEAGDIELIALWHALGLHSLLGAAYIDDPRDMPTVRAIRAIALRTDAISFDLPDGYRPPPDAFEDDPIQTWWAGMDSEEDSLLR
ncbi:hypothetical protein [Nocardia bhagyanarayanae]|uniref:Uncharacterized protein n=1 Tax=Nocardia bhagyanarayanae TaxID=1215925 RepID=A0A543FF35_9NOCA|nr:hypothetical protein [Nocardia bhagyanarayanae]TQM32381.1 hypothetical protein FB390_4060 [Nocardia bhagyanarayanae]